MQTYSEFVNGRGAPTEEVKALAAKIEAAFMKEFPNGWIQFKAQFLGGKGFNLYFGIVGNKDDLPSRIAMNDPLYHAMGVSPIVGGYEVELSQGRLNVEPEPGSYNVMSSLKTGFRKFKGDDVKVLDGFVKYFAKLKVLVKTNEAKVYGRARFNDKYFK